MPNRTHRIVFSDYDVIEGSLRTIKAMHRLREECIQEGSINDSVAAEYTNLRVGLAGGLETLIHKHPLFKENLGIVVEELNTEPNLVEYDPLQYRFWQLKCPAFCNALSNLLIIFMQERFYGVDMSHHVFQAVKYLISDREEQSLIAMPVIGGIELSKLGIPNWTYEYDEYYFSRVNAFTARIDMIPNEGLLRDIESYAASLGYSFLVIGVQPNEVKQFVKTHPDYSVSGKEKVKVVFRKKISNSDVMELPSLYEVYTKSSQPSSKDLLPKLAEQYEGTHSAVNWSIRNEKCYSVGLVKPYKGITLIQILARADDKVDFAVLLLREIKDRSFNLKNFLVLSMAGLSPVDILTQSFVSNPVYASFVTYKGDKKINDLYAMPGMMVK